MKRDFDPLQELNTAKHNTIELAKAYNALNERVHQQEAITRTLTQMIADLQTRITRLENETHTQSRK
jgi:septal ring factor EnvC (AmiA/AmiB activator)